MTTMSSSHSDHEDRWLITAIGAAVLVVVLAVAYLAYQASPTEGARPGSAVLPDSRSASEPQGQEPAAAGAPQQNGAPADDLGGQPSTLDSSPPGNPQQPPAEPEKEGQS